MTSRTKTLVALGCVAALAILFALVPRVWPNPQVAAPAPPGPAPAAIAAPAAPDPMASVPARSGLATTGSVDTLHSGATVTVVARGQAAHGTTPTITRDPLTIDGWALVDGKALGTKVVYRIDSGKWYEATYGVNRPDVATAFKNPTLAGSGFVAHVPIAALVVGHHTLRFSIIDGSAIRPIDDLVSVDLR